jgi:hypothetical protein
MDDGRHGSRNLNRREMLQKLAGSAASTSIAGWNLISQLPILGDLRTHESAATKPKTLSDQDDAFLHEIEAANFRYFWEQTNPETGIVSAVSFPARRQENAS